MTEPDASRLPPKDRIDAACDRFEAELREGREPRIEDWLTVSAGNDRTELLRELLAVEIAYSKRAGDVPRRAEYEQRFPDDANVITAVFAEANVSDTLNASLSPFADTVSMQPSADADAESAVIEADFDTRLGDYELQGEIARGGMGVIYRARDTALQRDIAIKVLLERYAPDSEEAVRFLGESRITGQLQHPAIPPVHQVGTLPDGRPFLAMKLIQGRTLGELLKERESPADDRGRFLAIFEQICQAMAYAHSRGVIHRDLKPSNVMVGAFGEVQVMDWGLAKMLTRSPKATQELVDQTAATSPVRKGKLTDQPAEDFLDPRTRAGDIMGTPTYMPPEQAKGEVDRIDQRADVFSLGAILCVLLTGKPPYLAQKGIEVLRLAAAGELGEARSRLNDSDADRELVSLCQHCLSADPEDRPRDADEIAARIANHLEAAEERARQAEIERVRVIEQRKRRRVQLSLAASIVGLTVAAGLGVVLASLWQGAEDAREQADSARAAAESSRDQLAVEERATEAARKEAVRQQQVAVTERSEADKAREEAVRLKGLAEAARKKVEHQRAKLAVVEYGRTMQVAHQAWRESNVVAARLLLESTDDELRGWEYRYVHRLCYSELITLTGHQASIASAFFSPDGRRVITASGDKTAKVWDAGTGAELLVLRGHTLRVDSARFSLDGRLIVTVSSDNSIKVWDAENGTEIRTLNGHTNSVKSVSFSADSTRIVTASWDKTAKVWDIGTGAELLTLSGHTDYVEFASFSPDGKQIVTASSDNSVKVWNAENGTEIRTLNGHTNSVKSVSFSPDSTRIVTASWDKTAKVWDIGTGAELFTLRGHTENVEFASFSPDGKQIVTASSDNTAKVWDGETGTANRELNGHTNSVRSVAFSRDGKQIVTASWDKTAKVWDAAAELRTFKGHTSGIEFASFSPDSKRIVTASSDDTARVWDAESGSNLLKLNGRNRRNRGLNSAFYSPDGKWIVTGSSNSVAQVWNARTGNNSITLLERSRGRAAATNPGFGVTSASLKGQHRGSIQFVSFNQDGKRIVTASGDTTAKVWNAKKGTEILTLNGHKGSVNFAVFSPGGEQIVTASSDEMAKVWDAGTGVELRTLSGHNGSVNSASFSSDGARIVTASLDKTAKVWDSETGAELLTLKGHTDGVEFASFSPDGNRIVTASSDETARVWDAATGAELLTLKMHKGPVNSASFSPDGRRIVTASEDKTAKVWDSWPFRESRPPDAVDAAPEQR